MEYTEKDKATLEEPGFKFYKYGDRWCGLITANLEIEPITILPRTDECMSSGTYTTLEFDHKTIRAIAYAHS